MCFTMVVGAQCYYICHLIGAIIRECDDVMSFQICRTIFTFNAGFAAILASSFSALLYGQPY